jgi:hypothetical protein
MAPIYQEISLEWKGVTYNITPTFEMIQEIEQRLSLASMVYRAAEEKPALSQLAVLLALVLRIAGCTDPDLTSENINRALWHGSDREALTEAASSVLFALIPPPDLPGNEGPPTVKKPPEGEADRET